MFYILLSAILLLPVFLGFGGTVTKIFQLNFEEISLKILLGIFSVSLLFTVLAFFVPLNIYVEISALFIGWITFFLNREYVNVWKFFARNRKKFFPFCLIILFSGSFYPFIFDHFSYYVPTIKWISEVGLVKGISNLDLLLGQMSVWHIFQAGFSNFSDPFLRMNTLVLIIYLIYIFEKKSWVHLVFIPILFLFSQSPSPDLPLIVFSLIILNEILESSKNSTLLFTLSIFVFIIKPTMIWLPMLSFLYSVIILKSSAKFVIPGVFVLFIFFVKNIWTFGFPVFPLQFLDFGFSWKPNIELLKNSSELAIRKTYDLQFSYAEIREFSTFDYIKNWFFLNGIKGKIHLLFVIFLITFLIYCIQKKSKIYWVIFISLLVKSAIVLAFSAQYRFFIDVFFVVFFVMFHQWFNQRKSLMGFAILSVFFTGILAFPNMIKNNGSSFHLGEFMGGFTSSQFYKPANYQLNQYQSAKIGNLQFNITQGYLFNFQTPIPAISPDYIKEDLDAGIFPQLKGNTLKEGFVWKKISSEEKVELRKILTDFQKSLDSK